MGLIQVHGAGRTEKTLKQVSLGNFGLEEAEDSEAQFPSNVKVPASKSYVRVLLIWEDPLTAGPLAEVPCISGNKRSQERWSF